MRLQRISVLGLLLLTLLSCSSPSPTVFHWRETPASFQILFPGAEQTEDVRCRGYGSGQTLTLTVESPARSAGVQIVCTGEACTLTTADGLSLPLTAEMARDVFCLTELLYGLPEQAFTLSRSPDGTETALTSSAGTLYLDAQLSPCAAETTRRLRISGWTRIS